MKDYIVHDGWRIIEDGFHPDHNKITESLMSLGNGRMGHRANFEERYSGYTLPGNYVAGVYSPDKTRVGWWKNGYPEYFAKVLNAANWIGIDIRIGSTTLDLHQCKVLDFRRELDMMNGLLNRTFTAELADGKLVKVHAQRFVSIAHSEIGAIRVKKNSPIAEPVSIFSVIETRSQPFFFSCSPMLMQSLVERASLDSE